MSRKVRILVFIVIILLILVLVAWWGLPRLARRAGVSLPGGSPGAVDVVLPPGFSARIFAQGLDRPRFMAFDANGVLLVAEMGAGRVVALPDRDADGIADETVVVLAGLDRPSSLAFHRGWLYVGETGQVRRYLLNERWKPLESQVVISDLPPGGAHVTRTVLVDPDDRLNVSIGSSCNVCIEEDNRRATISVYPADGGPGRILASGLRNAVGLALHPGTGELWATNNGRDWLGDDSPPDTVYVVREGRDYGWPRCHNGRIVDPDFGQRGDCDGVEAPIVEFPAHSAPLGLAFYTGDQFPKEYQGDLFVALHGSWNRSEPTGYKVVRIPLEANRPNDKPSDFATGWLQDNGTIAPGRPVGLVVAPDGSMMISDDKAGLVYCISYR